MTHYRHDEDYDSESEYLDTAEAEEPVWRPWRMIAVVLLLVCLGSGLAFGWRYYGKDYAGLAGQKTEARPDVSIRLQELQQSQQAIAADAQRNQEMLAAQQEEIKRLSEQIAQVAGNLDSLRASIEGAQASAPPPPQKKKPAPKPSIEQHNAPPPKPPSLAPEERQ